MRIIRLGPTPDLEKHHTCRNCGTEFAYMPIDVRSRNYKDYDGSSDTAFEVTCPAPQCATTIQVSRP